jgi:hypothetical protein
MVTDGILKGGRHSGVTAARMNETAEIMPPNCWNSLVFKGCEVRKGVVLRVVWPWLGFS